jgi:hypothetical protein
MSCVMHYLLLSFAQPRFDATRGGAAIRAVVYSLHTRCVRLPSVQATQRYSETRRSRAKGRNDRGSPTNLSNPRFAGDASGDSFVRCQHARFGRRPPEDSRRKFALSGLPVALTSNIRPYDRAFIVNQLTGDLRSFEAP